MEWCGGVQRVLVGIECLLLTPFHPRSHLYSESDVYENRCPNRIRFLPIHPMKRKPNAKEWEWLDPWEEAARKRQVVHDYCADVAAEVLRQDGIVVIDPGIELSAAHTAFLDYLATMPENSLDWTPGSGSVEARRYTAGGFGALGTASSFHAPFVRALRQQLHEAFRPIAQRLDSTANLESLIDRLLFRPAGDAPTGESVHRDQAAGLNPADVCFGGVLNLNLHTTQYLSVQKGTHFWSSAADGQNFTACTPAAVKEFKQRREDVAVPPGHFAIMVENLRHEVRSKKCRTDILRLFHGFRITHATTPLYPDNDAVLETQGIPQYKGGALPRMIPKLYKVNWLSKWREFSLRFVPGVLHTHVVAKDGRAYPDMVKEYCPSLEILGTMYPPYTKAEKAILRPLPC